MKLDLSPLRAFLEPHHEALATHASDVCGRLLRPLPEPEDDEAGRVQAREVLDWMGGSDLYAPVRDADLRALCLVREAVAAASPLADAVVALQALSITPMLLAENVEMRAAWAEPALRGAAMGAFAMTEPEAGSDVVSMQTRARRDGDGYVLDGSKTLISNAGIADFYVVFAVTDADAGARGLSAFVLGAATPGLHFAGAQVMSSPHPLGDLRLEACRVPAAARLGAEGDGFKLGMATLDRNRPTVGAAACGMATRALHEALAHVRARRQFGKPLAEFQLVQAKLSRMLTGLTASRLLVYRAAWDKDQGDERITLQAAMAKQHATETAQRVVDDAVQLLGGLGVLADSPVDRLYRSVRALRIYEGATDIQHLVIAAQLLRVADDKEDDA